MSNELNNQDFGENTSEKIRAETNKLLDEAEGIFKLAKEKGGNIDDIKEQYEEVREKAIEGYKNDNEITKQELSLIKLELSQLKNVYGKTSESIYSSSKKKILDFLSVPAIGLGYTTDDLKEWSFFSVDELNTKLDEEIAEVLGGKNIGFGNGYIKGFNSKIGNYVTKISDFEKKLQDTSFYIDGPENSQNTLNSLEIANYIMYLNENGGFNKDIFVNKFGEDKTKEIISIWSNKKETNAKKILKKNGFEKIIPQIIGFKNLFHSVENFTKGIKEKTNDEQIIVIDHLKKNIEGLKDNFIITIINDLSDTKYNEEEKKDIATKFVDEIINTKYPKSLFLKIESFKKEHNLSIENKDIFKNTASIQSAIVKKDYTIASYEGNNKLTEELLEELYKKELNLNTYISLSNKEIQNVTVRLQNGENYENIIKELAKENKELSIVLAKEKQRVEQEEQTKKNISNENIIYNTSEYNLNTSAEKPFLESNNGNKIEISEDERKIIENNPEALENLVHFYEFFKELNLESVWNYRKELMLSMGNMNINFIDNDSLSKSELVQFGNSLINAINNLTKDNKDLNTKPKLHTESSLSGVKNELRKFSGAGSILSNDKTSNLKGEDIFAATLRHFGIIGGAYFKINKLRENIK